jgi:polysaccharide export outer membrane protein
VSAVVSYLCSIGGFYLLRALTQAHLRLIRMKSNFNLATSVLMTLLACSILFSACSVNKDFIFRAHEDFVFNSQLPDSSNSDFKITANSILQFELYTNEGALVLEFTTSDVQRTTINAAQVNLYLVQSDGFCEFPVIGKINVSGLSIPECQSKLEEAYSGQFIKPYAIVKVVNRRALVYSGQRSEGSVVPLINPNVTLLEALSIAGGLGQDANASKVRVYRIVNGQQQMYSFDLSKIEGLHNAYFIIQNGDIIHVEPVPQIAREVQQDILPFVQIVSSLVIILGVFTRVIN